MKARDAVVKQNLEFIYGRKQVEKQLPDPDKYDYVRSAPVQKGYSADEAILDFSGLWEALSPSFECSVVLVGDKLPYPSFEHALQASKFLLQTDRDQIRQMTDILDIKRFASKHKNNIDRLVPNWQDNCLTIAKKLLRDKFMRSRPLKITLMKTGHKKLIFQNSYNDLFWGYSAAGKGQNHLGILLESIRTEIDHGTDVDLWVQDHLPLLPKINARIVVSVTAPDSDGSSYHRVEAESHDFDARSLLCIGSGDHNDICVSDHTVSRTHAVVAISSTSVLHVIDLGSSNGTSSLLTPTGVSTPLVPFAFTAIETPHNTVLTFGKCTFRYHISFTSDAVALRKEEVLTRATTEEPSSNNGKSTSVEQDENTLFVRGLAPETTEEDVRQFFLTCGSIKQVSVPKDRNTGTNRGIAFVTFTAYTGVLQGLALDGDMLLGRYIKIKKSDAAGAGGSGGATARDSGRGNGGGGGRNSSSSGGRGGGGRGSARGEGASSANLGKYGPGSSYQRQQPPVDTSAANKTRAEENRRDRSRSRDRDEERRKPQHDSPSPSPPRNRQRSSRDDSRDRDRDRDRDTRR